MTKVPMDATFRYERQGQMLRISHTGMTNHELREIIIGIWCKLDEADRADHIAELLTYSDDPDSWLGPIAVAIKRSNDGPGEGMVDLKAMAARGEKIRP